MWYSSGYNSGTFDLLFILYINDLPNCLSYTQPRMYADDTNLSFASDSIGIIGHKMNHDLVDIKEWLIANKLTLNKSKTVFMLICSRQKLRTFDKSPSLIIGGAPLNRVSNTKSLGLAVDENLSWGEHISRLCKKIASGVGAIKRTRSLFPRRTLQLVYNSLVLLQLGVGQFL